MDSKSHSGKNNVTKYRIIMILFALLLGLSLFVEYNKTLKINSSSNFISGIKNNTINDYISYDINGNCTKNVAMKDVKYIPLKKGDVMNITIKLDKNYSDDDVIMMMSEFCTIEAYVDKSLVYSYGHNLYQTGQCVGGGYYKIPITSNYMGKELQIKLKATENNYVSGLEAISMEYKESMINSFIMKNIITIVLAVSMFICAIIIFVFSFSKIVINSDAKQLCWVSICYILLSVWILCHFKILQIGSNNLQLISIIEYLCLYSAVIPCILFFKEYAKKKATNIIFNVYLGGYIIFILTTQILCLLDVIHYVDVLPIFHGFVMLGSILLIFFIIKNRYDISQEMEISFMFCMTFGIIAEMVEIIRFYLYAIFKSEFLSYSVMPIVLIIFVASIIYKYIIGILKKLYKCDQEKSLLDLAFKDQLTQVPNRTKCEEYMRTLSGKINEGYTVINLDLNNLKYVNDNFGHHIGDEMIFTGAQIIKDTFELYGQVGRMGGDEFIAIITITDKSEIENLIKEMNTRIDNFNKSNKKKYVLSIACGYAIKKKESTESIWKVYEEADKIMYEYKNRQKKKLNMKYSREVN